MESMLSLSSTVSPSKGTFAGRTGDEPVAMSTMPPSMISSPSLLLTARRVGERKRALPWYRSMLWRRRFSSMRRHSCASTISLRYMKSPTVTDFICTSTASLKPRWRNPERCSADSRRVLDGMVPVFTHAPPSSGSRSMSATRLPKYAACAAPFSPAGPEPITTKSYMD